MSRTVANLVVSSDTFQNWVNKTNELAYAFSTEIITANSSIGVTGTISEPRKSELVGSFGANTLVATNSLRGGNVGDSGSALLTITSNTLFGGNTSANAGFVNAQANVFVNNSITQINSFSVVITSNNIVLSSNSTANAITVTSNSSTIGTTIAGNNFAINTNTTVNASAVIVTSNTLTLRANSTATLFVAQGNGTTSNVIISGNLAQITSNLDVTGTVHTVAGNVNFDSGTVFVDSVNNRLGVNTASPDATITVIGTANVRGALTAGNTMVVTGNVSLSNTLAVTGNTSFSNTLAVTGNASFSNSVNITGTLAVSNTASFTNSITISNDTTFVYYANSNIGAATGSEIVTYSFDKNIYTSAKVFAQVKNSGNTLATEMIITHNGTSAYMTTYGTVVSPIGSDLGDFSIDISGSDVRIKFTQNFASSSVKILSQQMK